MSTAVATYNQLVQQQRDLSQDIEEALNALMASLESKLELATQQKTLQAEIPINYPEFSPADVRRKILDEVARRLEGRVPTPLRDWTTRVANSGGNLEE